MQNRSRCARTWACSSSGSLNPAQPRKGSAMVAEASANSSTSSSPNIPDALPVLPLRGGMVIFPLAVVPLLVGQQRSIQLIDDIMRQDRLLVLVGQKTELDQPGPEDLYNVGTAAIV